MDKFFSFKGFGSVGFVNSTKTFFKERWAATGPRFFLAGIGGGLAVFALYLAAAIATGNAHAQTVANSNTIKAVNGPLLLQGTNASGVSTQSVSISNVGHISGRSADFNGADGVSAVKLTMSNGGTISGSAQVVTIDAVGNGNIKLMDSTQVQGNITATGTISTSQAIQTTGTGSINSAFNLTAAGNKFNVAGDTGNVRTTGSVTAATGNFGGAGVGAGLVGVGAGNKIVLNGNNGNATVSGVALLLGGAYVAPRADDASLPALTVNGQGAFKGINNAGQKITGVGAGNVDATSDQAVNGSQLNTTNSNLASEVTTRTNEVARVDGRIDTETQARIDGDANTLTQANTYTDNHIQAQSGADRAYTNQQVGAERERAMAAEAAISKEVKQVGAMAMQRQQWLVLHQQVIRRPLSRQQLAATVVRPQWQLV
ncbi:hypothetical protein GHT06_001857 [Daphnia sinensis]|uniref:Uncharacterized protein n=1 Tax=Daphnia sinensis TaxID=1820382 RepID=A0AAD5KEJ7_9CRUS|nr:hypothetical protein GHT06_001857 [Daphnia sinensis]